MSIHFTRPVVEPPASNGVLLSGEREEEPLLEKNVELDEFEVMLDELVLEPFILEVASGGRTEKV